jgi:hypothetical protein
VIVKRPLVPEVVVQAGASVLEEFATSGDDWAPYLDGVGFLGAMGLVASRVGGLLALHDVRDPIVVLEAILRALRGTRVNAANVLAVVDHLHLHFADIRESGVPTTVAAPTAGVVRLVARLRPPVANVHTARATHRHTPRAGGT